MSGEGLDPIKRYIVKGIAGGIGLASESITSYKARRKTPPSHGSSNGSAGEEKQSSQYGGVWLDNEALCELEDTQVKVLSSHELDKDDGSHPESFPGGESDWDSFITQHPAQYPNQATSKLSMPVILPQRRPKTRDRGFVRAYAPMLGDCAISQDMFLEFLETFHQSSQASPWIATVNIAAFGLSFIPHFPMLVGIAIQAATMVAEDVQNRIRTNSFLDKANAEFFRPRGLYCLIMTYDPQAAEIHTEMQLSSTIASRLNPSKLQKLEHKFRESSGTTVSELELPEAAPLIFPVLDDMDNRNDQDDTSTKGKMTRKKNYIDEYFDKRARARFAGKNPDSILAQGPQPKFTSRYADPNHPASSGSFRSLITGGLINPPPMTRNSASVLNLRGANGPLNPLRELGSSLREQSGSSIQSRFGSQTYVLRGANAQPEENIPSNIVPAKPASTGLLGLPSPGGMLKKAMKSNVLYLMIVNMPTEEELAQAMSDIELRRKGRSFWSYVSMT